VETPSVVLVVMGSKGHFQRLRPLMAAFVERGIKTWVLTDREFEGEVRGHGAQFCDLYAGHTMDAADDESRPIPCRYVTFAACFAEEVAREVAAMGPSLIISDSFALIGRVVAGILGLPHISVCAGHDVDPTSFVSRIEPERISVSPRCHRAVDVLRDRFGLEDASPFSYGTSVSPLLNIYCEPAAFVSAETRRALGPIAFFGSLPPVAEIDDRRRPGARSWFGPDNGRLKVYASFGTVAWWYYTNEALASLGVIAETIAGRADVSALISLGNASLDSGQMASLTKSNVAVERYVNQWQALDEADMFLTHHGLNSTHEAIFSGVPMISHPFFGDQPSMATTCQDFGVAVPLGTGVHGGLDHAMVNKALDTCVAEREQLDAALQRARELELEVVRSRPEVVERILAHA
jgi:UDP:flavonoid glycosyltransferase YjiC (YdhE family)